MINFRSISKKKDPEGSVGIKNSWKYEKDILLSLFVLIKPLNKTFTIARMGIFLRYIYYNSYIYKILYTEIFCDIINYKLLSQAGVRQLVTGLFGIFLFSAACIFIILIKLAKRLFPKTIPDNKEIEDYIAQISHDLKSPAASLLNAVKILLTEDYGKLSGAQKTLLEAAYESCVYENKLISTIMDCYKYDHGMLVLSYSEFNISELLWEIEKSFSTRLFEKTQKIIIQNNLESDIIFADKLHLKRVLTNFLSNAVTYSMKNSEIEVNLRSVAGAIEVNVINRSLVQPTENLNHVFEKFKTYKNSKYNKTSVGLGLYLSKQIIEAHNGKIFARIESDGRCLFGFRIPSGSGKVEKISRL